MFSFNIIDRYEEKDIKELQYWKKDFNELIPVEDYDCVITPGNSFGIMDGGFDKVILDKYPEAQKNIQQGIGSLYGRELPVGSAISTRLELGVTLVYVPTMRFPGPVTDKAAAYNSAMAAFSLVRQLDKFNYKKDFIKKVVMPLFATATGGIPPKWSARQICLAYKHLQGEPAKNWNDPKIKELQAELAAATNFINLRTGK